MTVVAWQRHKTYTRHAQRSMFAYRPLEYQGCQAPAGAKGATWTMKGKARETCLNGPSLNVSMKDLEATEQHVNDWCARTKKRRCRSMLDVVLALTAPLHLRHGTRVSTRGGVDRVR